MGQSLSEPAPKNGNQGSCLLILTIC